MTTCDFQYVRWFLFMQDKYVHMQLIYVDIRDKYFDMYFWGWNARQICCDLVILTC